MSNEAPSQSGAPSVVINTGPAADQTGIVPTFQKPGDKLAIQGSFGVRLDQHALASIVTTSGETKIRQRITELKAKLDIENKELVRHQKAHTTYLESFTKNMADRDDRLPVLSKAYLAFSVGKVSLTYGVATFNERTGRVAGVLTVRGDDFSFTYTYDSDPLPEFLSTRKTIEEITERVVALSKEIAETRLALGNVDALERKALAALAKQAAISSGEEGAAFVKSIEDSINVDTIVDELRS